MFSGRELQRPGFQAIALTSQSSLPGSLERRFSSSLLSLMFMSEQSGWRPRMNQQESGFLSLKWWRTASWALLGEQKETSSCVPMRDPHFNSVCPEYMESVPVFSRHTSSMRRESREVVSRFPSPQIKVQSTEHGGLFTGEPTADLSRLYTGCLATLQR